MKNNTLFKEMENIQEIEQYVKDLNIKRNVNKIQIHHMALPDYDCWIQDLARWGEDAELKRTDSLNSYGKTTWNSNDGEGRYIAQHFSIFPNGHVTTGRSIESTPIGIKGWNTGAVCIEVYGDFDKGKDKMTNDQLNAIVALIGSLAKKVNLAVNETYIRPHCWFTPSGSYLEGYHPTASTKTCPGIEFTNAFGGLVDGYGNSKSAFNKYFYPAIQNYINGGIKNEVNENTTTVINPENKPTSSSKYIVRYLQQCLNESYGCKLAVDGLYGKASKEQVSKHYLKKGAKGQHVIWLQKALVNRGFNLNIDGIFGNDTLKQLKAYQKARKLTQDGLAGAATHQAIIND